MRLLLDECIPRKLKAYLSGHECRTTLEAGWAGKKNGELLTLAEGSFDVFLTLDKGVQYQQNLSGRRIGVLIIRVRTNRIEDVMERVPACLRALQTIQPGQIIRLGLSEA
jgi:predicted nuclease of predicted toxin-antitoxin system